MTSQFAGIGKITAWKTFCADGNAKLLKQLGEKHLSSPEVRPSAEAVVVKLYESSSTEISDQQCSEHLGTRESAPNTTCIASTCPTSPFSDICLAKFFGSSTQSAKSVTQWVEDGQLQINPNPNGTRWRPSQLPTADGVVVIIVLPLLVFLFVYI